MTEVRKHKTNRPILLCTLILMAIGLIVIYAIGPLRANVLNNAYGQDNSPDGFFIGQLRSVVVALVAFFAAFKFIPNKWLKKLARPTMYIALALSVLLWILSLTGSSLARCELGACRWFNLPVISSFQPAEFLKLGMVLYLSDFLTSARENHEVGRWKEFWLPLFIICGAAILLVVFAQNDLGTGVVLVAIFLGMLLVSGVPMKQYLCLLGAVGVVGVCAVLSSPNRLGRVDTWVGSFTGDILNGTDDASYHIDNAMLAIGMGGFFGTGIGNSVQATGYLPESINDSIFAVMGEISGFFGLSIVILLFILLLWNILHVAGQASKTSDQLIATGVFSWLLVQIVLNIAAMTGLIPITGITLPLLSYGGTSMVCVAFAIGLVSRVSCYTNREQGEVARQGRGGALYREKGGVA